MPVEQLSGVTVVIIIAICVEACIVLLIFVRRQIMRFGLRNRRGPHTHIGHGGPKSIRRGADRALDYIPYIKYEPPLSSEGCKSSHYYRIKATEAYRAFEKELAFRHPNVTRLPGTNIRAFLYGCLSGPLNGASPKLVNEIGDDYSNARHHFGEFGEKEYLTFEAKLERLTLEIRKPGGAVDKTPTNISEREGSLLIDSAAVLLDNEHSSGVGTPV